MSAYNRVYLKGMGGPARRALATIRRCIAADRVMVRQHFTLRLDQRGATWPDVLTVIDSPRTIRGDGVDDWGRTRWILSGLAADGLRMGIACAIGRDAAGELTVFVTLFWED